MLLKVCQEHRYTKERMRVFTFWNLIQYYVYLLGEIPNASYANPTTAWSVASHFLPTSTPVDQTHKNKKLNHKTCRGLHLQVGS